MQIVNYLWQNINRLILNKKYWGFIRGHDYLSLTDYNEFTKLITKPDSTIRKKYEEEFSSYLGIGKCLSFAAGRMAFYTLLKCFEIKEGDEVILTGFTCSVMVNAIKRAGAIPVYIDIDPETYGSSPEDVKRKITDKTKVIVAQHSFGIPCKIDLIKQISDDNNIFLIEDCALSFGSAYKGIILGNWGHAAIFSTDHSKPLNTLTGGMLYTLNDSIFRKAKELYNTSSELSIQHQNNILKQILLEGKYCNPKKYAFYKLLFVFDVIKSKLFKENAAFLSDDSYATVRVSKQYSYPSKMPVFLCHLGLLELARFNTFKNQRINCVKEYIELVLAKNSDKYVIPKCYFDPNSEIVPLRFVFENKDPDLENKLSAFIDTSWFWFKEPIIATTDQLSDFDYKLGSCPVSEFVGVKVINFPCVYENEKIIANLNIIM
jgi:perosamine synthetase